MLAAGKQVELWFDPKRVNARIAEKSEAAGLWFGKRTRDRARSYLGKPNIAGDTIRTRSGSERVVKRRKPRPAPKPPIPRVPDSRGSIRNIQFSKNPNAIGPDVYVNVQVYNVKLPNGAISGGKTVPEVQEFGGTTDARARVVTQRTKTGKPRQSKGQPQKRLIFSSKFPQQTFRVPKRPYLSTTFAKVTPQLESKIAQGKFS